MAMKPIKESERKYWDVAVFIVILIATFEIPYDLLVGHTNKSIQNVFDIVFYAVFGIDIILNLFIACNLNHNIANVKCRRISFSLQYEIDSK